MNTASTIPDWVKSSQVGDKIVCSTDLSSLQDLIKNIPLVGGVYTIRSIKDGWYGNGFTTCFRLEEVVNQPQNVNIGYGNLSFEEVHFSWFNFKPLTRKPTDISIFTDMLVKNNNLVSA